MVLEDFLVCLDIVNDVEPNAKFSVNDMRFFISNGEKIWNSLDETDQNTLIENKFILNDDKLSIEL